MNPPLSSDPRRDTADRQDWSLSWHIRALAFIFGGLLLLFASARILMKLAS